MTMKLSEAIREGAKKRPMGMHKFFQYAEDGSRGIKSCALGAAYEAATGRTGMNSITVRRGLYAAFPYLAEQPFFENPKGHGVGIDTVVACMNDDGGYTREEIADWLESIGL